MDNIVILQAVEEVYENIKDRDEFNWRFRSESELFEELVACILGSLVTYELALEAKNHLKQSGLLNVKKHLKVMPEEYQSKVLHVLSTPMESQWWRGKRKYRFFGSKSSYITESYRSLYIENDGIKNILLKNQDVGLIRRELVKLIKGFGPKQASLFLRNIGFSQNIAILDSHVLNFMNIIGLIKSKSLIISTVNAYEKIEELFTSFVDELEKCIAIFDEAVWVVMRVYLRENI